MSTRDNLISYFKDELKSTRTELNLTQGKMAEKLGIDLRTYSDLERGKSFCSMYTFINLAYKCNIDANEILSTLGEILNNPKS